MWPVLDRAVEMSFWLSQSKTVDVLETLWWRPWNFFIMINLLKEVINKDRDG